MGECWVYVIFFACAYGGEVRMLALQLGDPKSTFMETGRRPYFRLEMAIWLFIDFMAIYSYFGYF